MKTVCQKTITLPVKLDERTKDFAKETSRKYSAIVRMALEEFLKNEDFLEGPHDN